MANYSTPDVYVEEISTLPPSIAEVSTAVPAFIGYTELTAINGVDLKNVPTRITNLLEYTSIFGGPYQVTFTVTVNASTIKPIVTDESNNLHKLYYSLDHYFKNGGSDCYIISVGNYGQKAKTDFEAGLNALSKEDEPTLIILSEAVSLGAPDYYDLCQQALAQCARLKDRFCIFDVLNNDNNGQAFKGEQGIGMQNLKYGAAYYPFLNTSLNYIYADKDITVSITPNSSDVAPVPVSPQPINYTIDLAGVRVSFSGVTGDTPTIEVVAGATSKAPTFSFDGQKLTITNVGANGKSGNDVITGWSKVTNTNSFKMESIGDGSAAVVPITQTPLAAAANTTNTPPPSNNVSKTLAEIKTANTSLYNNIKLELNKLKVVLPPAPAVAGVYSTVDRERGVWKAPANVGLNAVVGPVVKITADDQERLNVDETGGKSINAIRSFMGKGTMVWGARTLAGNDNEWRYVPVRRLFNMIEESAKKASYFAVFEPNDPTTWIKVKGMIESFLYGLWQQGALAGSDSKTAYYVNVGLGATMTQQDILEGRMIIEIGIAAVRPAEFIILKFSHKLQEA